MKRKILLSVVTGILALTGWMYFAPRIRVDDTARHNDPGKLKLSHVSLMHKSYKRLPNGIEAGLVHLNDGGDVKYWYISGHVQPGLGLTRFDFPHGETAYLRGAFCCEVWIEDAAVENKASLLKFIAEHDGASP